MLIYSVPVHLGTVLALQCCFALTDDIEKPGLVLCHGNNKINSNEVCNRFCIH